MATTDETRETARPGWPRFAWFVAIWAGSVAAMFALAAVIRFWIA